MNDQSDNSSLDLLLARALKQYAPHATVAERTALDHLAKQLETHPTDVDFRLQRENGRLTVECKPLSYTTDKRRPATKVRKKP